MNTLIKWGDVIAVAAGGVALAVADAIGDVSAVWWAVWIAGVATVAGSRIYRYRLTR